MASIPVLLCEAQPIIVEGVRRVFAEHPAFELTGWVPRLSEALEEIRRSQPVIFIADQSAGTNSILRFVALLKTQTTSCYPVLWASELAEADALRALQLGIRGVVKKNAPVTTFIECLNEVAAGRVWMEDSAQLPGPFQRRENSRLTAREMQVVRAICSGLKNKQIAEKLGITPGTVKVHLMHIFEKTGLKDRFALAVHGRNLPGITETDNGVEPKALLEVSRSEVGT